MRTLRNKHRREENFDSNEHQEKERKRIKAIRKKAETARGTECQPQRKLQVEGNGTENKQMKENQ